MLKNIRSFVPLALVLALAAQSPFAQVAEFGATWPFTACTAVVNDSASGTMYVGFGSGVVVLRDTSSPPNPELMPGGVANMLRPGGLVKDLAVTSNHLYIAAHRGGLVRNNRELSDPLPEWTLDTATVKDAWAVTVPVRVGNVDLVFVGTNDGGSGGRVIMVRADIDPQFPPQTITSYDVGGPVYSLASMVQPDGAVTLLVGAQCGYYTSPPDPPNPSASVVASLFRFDFAGAATELPQSFPEPSAIWTAIETIGDLPMAVPTIIRDIVIDPNPQAPVAYVAAFTRGLRKFNLANGSLTEVVAGDWPILTGPQQSQSRFDGLAFHSSGLGTFVAAALGPPFADEQQVLGLCTQQFACDDPVAAEARGVFEGVVLYDVSQSSPEKVAEMPITGCGGANCLTGPPLGLAIRPVGSSLRLDAACTTGGLSVVTASAPDFSLQAFPGWDEADGFPTSTFDDLVQVDHWLVASYEIGLALFDLLDTPLLSEPESLNSVGGGVVLSGFAAEGSVPAMVFSSAQASGVAYYQLEPEAPHSPLQFLGFGGFPNGSSGRIYALQALPPSASPDSTPWLITVNGVELDTVNSGCGLLAGGGVRIWRLADTDQDGKFEPTEATPIGSYAPNLCEGFEQHPSVLLNADKGGAWFDVRVGPASGNVFPIFVTYSPRNHGTTRGAHLPMQETGAGVIALKGVFQANGADQGDDRVQITWVGKVPAVTTAEEESAGRLAFDATSGHIVACLGCNGVGSYQANAVDVPPTLLGTWSSPTRSFLHPVFPLGSANFVYVTELSGAVLVFDTAAMSLGPAQTVLTLRTATALLPQATSLPGPRFLLTDGRGGVHELQFLSSP